MPTIGFDKLYYAPITESEGEEAYGTPVVLAKAISADLSVEFTKAPLYADDGEAHIVQEFKTGALALGVDEIGADKAAALIGATVDANKVLISTSEDVASPVAVGFRARLANGKYRYYWLYRVLFGVPKTVLATKGESIAFTTPTIEGTIQRRKKADAGGKHPWKAEVTEGDTGVVADTLSDWYTAVYEPDYETGT